MTIDYSHKDLRNAKLKGQSFAYVSFSHSDLRGADLSESNLTGADFSNCRTGITLTNTILIFFFALIVSALSGYMAMLAGSTIHHMLESQTENVRMAGIISLVTILLFVIFSVWKGVGHAITTLVLPVSLVAVIIGLIAILTGTGTGEGVFYLIISLLLVVVMFVIGTIARASAGSLSNILFIVVALTGGMFGRNVGGGIGTIIMALACVQISKRALKGHAGFESLTKVALFIVQKFGTSFRNSKLSLSHFAGATIQCTDFSGADLSYTDWADAKTKNCIVDGTLTSNKNKSESSKMNTNSSSNNAG